LQPVRLILKIVVSFIKFLGQHQEIWGRIDVMLPVSLYLVLSLVFLAGCAEKVLYPRIEPTMWSNYFQMQDIKPGMTKEAVISRMGPPRVAEEGRKPGESILFYQTHNMDTAGSETVRGGLTPFVFQDDRLVAIGQRPYNRATGFPEKNENALQYQPMSFPDRQDNTLPYNVPRSIKP
jgi:Protein of unknown function (DUF3192)